jgi:glycosyltransferase involved in cell wall biosynthesis
MRIIVEADSIATDRMSGIGHATLEIIRELEKQITSKDSLVLVVPFGKKSYLDKYYFKKANIRSLLPGYKYINYLLVRTSFPVPVDFFFGKGLYIFPNYKNWFVPRSFSLTFVHDVAYKIFPETIHPKNLVYLNKNMDRWLNRTTKIAAISQSSAKEISQYFPNYKNKIVNIPLGVNPTVFSRTPENETEKAKKKIGITGRYFIYVGNIEPRKNIDILLDAYKEYSDHEKDPAQLLIVGGGGWSNESTYDHMKTLQGEGYGIVKSPTYVNDDQLPALYSGANALVHVSLHEGFGLSVVQAQACGTPVILSKIPVLNEISVKKNRLFVVTNDISAIAKAMHDFDGSKKYTQSPVVKYTWTSTVQKIMSITGIVGDKNAR